MTEQRCPECGEVMVRPPFALEIVNQNGVVLQRGNIFGERCLRDRTIMHRALDIMLDQWEEGDYNNASPSSEARRQVEDS